MSPQMYTYSGLPVEVVKLIQCCLDQGLRYLSFVSEFRKKTQTRNILFCGEIGNIDLGKVLQTMNLDKEFVE